ncbi:hypothetical protein AAVH_09283 [Aphelenchoides avenae]|nr:hypothetical protein AAVH_09283 [Aphelenchus avenae]
MFSQLAAKEDQPRQFIAREGNGVDNPTESRDGVNDVSDAYTYMSSTSCDAATQFDARETESIADEREAPVSSADVEQFADLSEEDVTSLAVEAYRVRSPPLLLDATPSGD